MAFGMSAAAAGLVGSVAAPLVGGLLGGSGGGSGGGSQPAGSTTTSNAPWSGAQPYLNGAGTPQLDAQGKPVLDARGQPVMQAGSQGIFPLAQAQYAQGNWTQPMQDLANSRAVSNNNAVGAQQLNAGTFAQKLMNGTYNPNITPVGNVNAAQMGAAPNVSASNISANNIDPLQAFNSFGQANPTAALQQSLSGQVNNPYLAQMANAITAQSNQNLAQNVMPGIGHGAEMAGQYGGSRQGIAQGVAAGNAQVGLDNSIANMYGNAYGQAQNLMGNTANSMAGLGINNAQANSGRDLQAQTTNAGNALHASQINSGNTMATNQSNQSAINNMGQFNANLGLQNNTQNAALQNQIVVNGMNSLTAGNNLLQTNTDWYNTQQELLNAPNAQNRSNLNNYASIVSPGAGMGSQTSQPYFTNQAANVLGGAAMGAGLFGNMNWGGNATGYSPSSGAGSGGLSNATTSNLPGFYSPTFNSNPNPYI